MKSQKNPHQITIKSPRNPHENPPKNARVRPSIEATPQNLAPTEGDGRLALDAHGIFGHLGYERSGNKYG